MADGLNVFMVRDIAAMSDQIGSTSIENSGAATIPS
jgi:hypothetical protein